MALALLACGNGDDTPADAGELCAQEVTSSSDGTTPCASRCPAGFHCDTARDACLTGCTSAASCRAGEFCDLTGATHDQEGTTDGVCRTPDATCLGVTDDAGADAGAPRDSSTKLDARSPVDAGLDASSASDAAADTGTAADTGSGVGGACNELQVCCRAIKDVDTQNKCEGVVATVDTPTCQNALTMYEADGACP